ncbi:MAG: hypothetical protein A3B78_02980 [Omnitrophica WOR_2 bacterium RIFCSPHIGHO2_02_FULL_67_20]|nr:MAG: hypothetical protein A3B78_02980 [Omnitrophica WOR_2 bacterium RIFCSPHIGHO2_02_FULL_67_20]
MNLKAWAKATLGAFVAIFAAEFLIHHVWLGGFYKAHAVWWRPAAQMGPMMPLMFAAQLVLAALLTVVYAKGYEPGKGGAGQGFRFGVLIGLLLMLPCSLMNAVIYPYPMSLIVNWLVGGLAEIALAGAVIGALYKPGKQQGG